MDGKAGRSGVVAVAIFAGVTSAKDDNSFYRSAAFALEIENGSQEDAAIAGGPRSEEATRERLRFAEERGNQRAVRRAEILVI